ncbi:MAG: Eco57I restriction-modification methylase domain-containing protein, partial [Bacteroidetes bacterium]|nr:Eco57I restriction-modification methylase domain-containing protein [Bacteroidota bacterium]
KVEVENDELLVTWHGDLFRYQMTDPESCRIQESLFHEKQTLIENCLFGVDINPKSVMICRLRLWVELLKNAYYKNQLPAGRTERQLETLPNIDINIKCGNSLISRFALNADLKEALKRSKHTIDSYRDAIKVYRHAETKDVRREMERLIGEIKTSFQSEITRNDPKAVKLYKLAGELTILTTQTGLFGMTDTQKKDWTKQVDKLTAEVKKLEADIEDIRSNKIYENAFEWRFEFPEVLNDEGEFVGFDVVIGNPPYIRQEELTEFKPLFQSTFSTFAGTADLYVYFVEQGLRLLKPNGEFAFILPNKWMRTGYGKALRIYLKDVDIRQISDFGDLPVFEEATTYPCILEIRKTEATESFLSSEVKSLQFPNGLEPYLSANSTRVLTSGLKDAGWTLNDSSNHLILEKLRLNGIPLKDYIEGNNFYGIKTGFNEAFVINKETRDRLISEDSKSAEIIKPFLAGRDVKRFSPPLSDQFLILLRNGDTRKWFGNKNETDSWALLQNKYPAITAFLQKHEEKARLRLDQGEFWWELRACAYYDEFEKGKIIYPNICKQPEFTLDSTGVYTNQKCFIITKFNKTFLGILNSRLMLFLFKAHLPMLRGGFFEPSYLYFKDFPIVAKESAEIENLVDQILLHKKANPQADTTELERQIDQLVYKLYDLTEEEIRVVEGE